MLCRCCCFFRSPISHMYSTETLKTKEFPTEWLPENYFDATRAGPHCFMCRSLGSAHIDRLAVGGLDQLGHVHARPSSIASLPVQKHGSFCTEESKKTNTLPLFVTKKLKSVLFSPPCIANKKRINDSYWNHKNASSVIPTVPAQSVSERFILSVHSSLTVFSSQSWVCLIMRASMMRRKIQFSWHQYPALPKKTKKQIFNNGTPLTTFQ